jgi:hypothetical protein
MSQKSLDLAGLRVGLALVIAQKKHERLSDSIAHDAAKGSPVHIDASLASGIVVAELQGCGTTERVAEHPDALHIEPSQEPARRVRRVQSFELIEREAHISAPF